MAQPPYPQQPVPPYPRQPQKPRPRVLWFFVGGGLLLLALLVFVAALFTALRPLFHEDAVFPASATRTLDLPAHVDRGLFADSAGNATVFDCSATDGSGADLPLRPVSGDFTVNEWTAVYRFDTGDGHVTLDCTSMSPGTRMRVGELPATASFVGSLVVAILLPMLLGLAGVVILIVTTVLFLTRPARPRGEAR